MRLLPMPRCWLEASLPLRMKAAQRRAATEESRRQPPEDRAAIFRKKGSASATMVASAAVFGLLLATFSASRDLSLSMTLLFCAAFASSMYLNIGMTTLQLLVPDELRGRVMGIWSMTMHDRAYEEFRARMAALYPGLDGLLENGDSGLEEWWEAVKAKAEADVPGLGSLLDQIDFVGLYNSNVDVPNEDTAPFIPFRFHAFAAATTMTRS